jgi:predicted Zn-dependent protease
MRTIHLLLLVLFVTGTVTGCSVNPVTGKRQLNFYSEDDEVSMGAEADPSIKAQYGVLDDADLQSYVDDIGQRLAQVSHRPTLEFHFTVLDDPIVNAFALPGGYCYVTRGILAYLNNEAALAGVMGHEVGHVTAQHGVTKMSTQGLAGIGLAVGSAVAADIPFVSDLAGTAAGLLFLKYGRDDERQSDELGVQYATTIGYDTREMADFFHTLDRLSPEGGGMPGWMSTHPDPGERWVKVGQLTEQQWRTTPGPYAVERDRYLDMIDGIMFGTNPREGFFSEGFFHHPDLRFRMPVPEGWKGQNTRAAVAVFEPEQKAVVILGAAQGGETAREAADAWLAQEGVENLGRSGVQVAGSAGIRTKVRAQSEAGPILVISTFFDRDGAAWAMHGYATEADFPAHEATILSTMDGFANETDPAVLNLQPVRVDVVTNDTARTFAQFAAHHPIPDGADIDSVEGLAILNGMESGTQVPAGMRLKVLVRSNP